MRFAGIDVGAERHMVAMVGEDGEVLCRSSPFGEDASGYAHLFELLGQPEGSSPFGEDAAWMCAWGPYTSRSDLLCRCGRERLPTAVVFYDPVNLLPVLLHGGGSNTRYGQ